MFEIDLSRYRIVDVSFELKPHSLDAFDKPFDPVRGTLPDETFKHTVTIDTHTGTHIEYPVHFVETGKKPEDYPLEYHMGRGLLVDVNSVKPEPVGASLLEEQLGAIIREGDILLFRNVHPEAQAQDPDSLPYLDESGARWIMDHKVKMIMLTIGCHVRLAKDVEHARGIHEILMGGDNAIPITEIGSGLEKITRKEFFFMALPFRATGVDSLWARAIVIEER